ncbi:GIY-YIG nuclease family protein [Zeaxanthinibacter enoshimensis]|uniref:GIY-YIG nuclease family protein n=1 Tax=Zeaxanthinibacter enoshimensis TaxID=392009 RepID=UPI0010622B24|nr:GIY-YIG nuclease family protein [Zeaxanthinibacter enoshimensis]
MEYFIYIIQSEITESYYIGYSSAPYRRLKEHNEATFNTFTSKYRPWILKALFNVGRDRGVAENLE